MLQQSFSKLFVVALAGLVERMTIEKLLRLLDGRRSAFARSGSNVNSCSAGHGVIGLDRRG